MILYDKLSQYGRGLFCNVQNTLCERFIMNDQNEQKDESKTDLPKVAKKETNKSDLSSENTTNYKILKEKLEVEVNGIKESINIFKWFAGTLATVYTLFLVGSYINYSLERQSLEEFKKETRDELLGEIDEEADIKMLGKNNSPLENQTIEIDKLYVRRFDDNRIPYKTPRYNFTYSITIKNEGKGLAKNAVAKFYWTEDLAGDFSNSPNTNYSTDEPDFDYEAIDNLSNGPIGMLRFNMSYSNSNRIWVFGKFKPGTYPMKTKIYYGEDKVVESNYKIKISPNVEVVEIFTDDSSKFNDEGS